MMNKLLRFFCLALAVITGSLSMPANLQAQQGPDSLAELTLATLLQRVQEEHPLTQNANLFLNQAAAQLRIARGGFDPKFSSDWEQKAFDGKQYFTLAEHTLKAPTPLGLQLKGGFNLARGVFLNPENKLPTAGQAVLGFDLPLLQGLTFDPARAELRQARLNEETQAALRQEVINDLLLETVIVYYNWAVAYQQLRINEQALAISQQRLRDMVTSFQQGDKPAIDTLETFIQVQNRSFDLNESRLDWENSGQTLGNYWWVEGQPRPDLIRRFRPEVLPRSSVGEVLPLQEWLNQLDATHPLLQQLRVQQRSLEVDRRLASEMLKPQVTISYNLLADGLNFRGPQPDNGTASLLQDVLLENYKWGLKVGFPLFWRKERGKLALVQVKQQQTDNKLAQKRLELETKVRNYYNNLTTIRQQLDLYNQVVENYQALLTAERRKFDIGESSVFLLNTREQKLFEAQLKQVKLQGELQKYTLALYWASGRLPAF